MIFSIAMNNINCKVINHCVVTLACCTVHHVGNSHIRGQFLHVFAEEFGHSHVTYIQRQI